MPHETLAHFFKGELLQLVIEPPSTKDADALADVYIRSLQATSRNILPDDYLDNLSYGAMTAAFIAKLKRPDRFMLVARFNGVVIGYGYFGPQGIPEVPYDGEIVELYVRPESIGQGVGKQLVYSMMGAMAAEGLTSYSVWCLSSNARACRFYTSLRAQKLAEGPVNWPDIEDLTFDAICYCWPPRCL